MIVAARREIRQSIARGEYLQAYDQAKMAGAMHPADVEIAYLAVLSLARSGALQTAEAELSELLRRPRRDLSPRLKEDIAALGARLAKDSALEDAAGLPRLAAVAAARYEDVFARFGRPYSCINAATMWRLAGKRHRSRKLARKALALAGEARGGDREARYWAHATMAEAAVLLDRPTLAAESLDRARAAAPGLYGAWAATRRQFRLMIAAGCGEPSLMALLPVPRVIHFCGHMSDPEADGDDLGLRAVAAGLQAALDVTNPGTAFGSLAYGSDILVAEALLERGADLHVVLPFDADDFRRISVSPGGPQWERRFDDCLARAASVQVATDGRHLGDDALFAHGARVAMGLALVHARRLETDAVQVALWDGRRGSGQAGTAADVRAWRAGGRHTLVVKSPARAAAPGVTAPVGRPAHGRQSRAMLFGDISGYGGLADEDQVPFVKVVLGTIAEVLRRHRQPGMSLRTSGDGFFAVFRSASSAARCALELQERFAQVDLGASGLPSWLGLRIGGHAGPVLRLFDPIRREHNHYGLQVTRAARIEPRTPVGEVYVTAPFAALVELEQGSGVKCEYVGHLPTAKEHGVLPMYVLKRHA